MNVSGSCVMSNRPGRMPRRDIGAGSKAEDSRKLPEDGAGAELLHIDYPGVGLSINDTGRLVFITGGPRDLCPRSHFQSTPC